MTEQNVATEITPEEGILKIRKAIGRWLSPNGIKAREAVAHVANILMDVRVPSAEILVMSTGNERADALLRQIEHQTDKALSAPPPRAFPGLISKAPVDIADHLQDMIDQSVNKPGEWREGMLAGGSIINATSNEEIGNLSGRRDAFLVIDAVNALPQLLARLRSAEKGERAADLEVTRLEGLLEAATVVGVDACNAVIDQTQALRDVTAERLRQMTVEGYKHDRDDCYTSGELAQAAGAYAIESTTNRHGEELTLAAGDLFPWDLVHWKPTDHRSNLVRAGALILAEIERLDRAALNSEIAVAAMQQSGVDPELYTAADEARMDVIGQNGNGGEHYAESDGEGWIAWESQKDGTCPVEAGVLVDVKFRGGEVALGVPALTSQAAAGIHWDFDHLAHDIVFYRLSTQP